MAERAPGDALVWRVVRRLLPAAWRDQHAADVLAVHVSLAGGPARARGPVFWSRVARDVVLTSVQIRLDGWRAGAGGRGRAGVVDAALMSLRLALRGLRRTPVFGIGVVVILGLGIATNVTMFRVLDRLLLSPPGGIRQAESVRRVHVYGQSMFTGTVGYSAALSYPDYRTLREVGALDAVAGYGGREMTLLVDGRGELLRAEYATASYFGLLGVSPALGRFYGEDEDRLGAGTHAVVLGHAFWQRRFGGDPGVLGRSLDIGKGRYTVVGVAPRGFTGVNLTLVDVWLPLVTASEIESGTQWVDAYGWSMMGAVARVSPDRRLAAEDAASAMRRADREGRPGFDPESRVVLSPLIAARGPNASRESQVARLLGVLAVLVLLITCANVGNLFLARVLSRRREIAVQAALGVSGRRLFSQLFLEVATLALLAAGLSLWLSGIAGRALFGTLLPDATPPGGPGWSVALATAAIAFVAAGVTAFLPALRAARTDVMDTLRRGRTTTTSGGTRGVLLMAQAALSVVLLVGAGLFIRSLQRAEGVDLGYDRSTLIVDVELEGGIGFGAEVTKALRLGLSDVRASTSVASAAAASLGPASGVWGLSVRMPGGDSVPSGPEGPWVYAVSGDYFATLGVEIVKGRPITDADDRPGAPPVAVVSERFARAAWPGVDALGRCLIPERGDDATCATVVGVAGDVLVRSVTDDAPPMVFYLTTHHPAVGDASANTLLVRARPGANADMVRRDVQAAIPGARFATAGSIEERIAPQFRSWRLGASLLTAFGLLALLIAAAGLYSTLAFDLTQRRRELGVRAALGAPASRLVRSIMAHNAGTLLAGIALGLVLALALGRVAQAMLFRVDAADPLVIGIVLVTLLLVGTLAAALPAWSATRVDPATPLREE